jgi:hypothetical protein
VKWLVANTNHILQDKWWKCDSQPRVINRVITTTTNTTEVKEDILLWDSLGYLLGHKPWTCSCTLNENHYKLQPNLITKGSGMTVMQLIRHIASRDKSIVSSTASSLQSAIWCLTFQIPKPYIIPLRIRYTRNIWDWWTSNWEVQKICNLLIKPVRA